MIGYSIECLYTDMKWYELLCSASYVKVGSNNNSYDIITV